MANKALTGAILHGIVAVYFSTSMLVYNDKHQRSDFRSDDEYYRVMLLIKYWYAFMTNVNFMALIVFTWLALLDQIALHRGYDESKRKYVYTFRTYMFYTSTFPITSLVFLGYFTFSCIDKHLVLGENYEVFFPEWLNQTLHTLIIIPILVELWLPKNNDVVVPRKLILIWISAILIIYLVVFYILVYVSGIFFYPFYDLMTVFQRVLFTAASVFSCIMFSILGHHICERKTRAHLERKKQ